MSNKELKLNIVTTTESVDPRAPKLTRQQLAADLKKRLDAKKGDIFRDKSKVYGSSSTEHLVTEANKVLEDDLLKVGNAEINDGNEEYVIYYTGTDGRQYSLDLLSGWDPAGKNAMTDYFNIVFEEVTYRLAEQKLTHLQQRKASGDVGASAALNALGTDLAKIQAAMWNEVDIAIENEFLEQVKTQRQSFETEILQAYNKLIQEAGTFAGNYRQMEDLEKRILAEETKINTALPGLTGAEKQKYEGFASTLANARLGLPDMYIDSVIAKHVTSNPNTPSPDPLPGLSDEIVLAISLIDKEIIKILGVTMLPSPPFVGKNSVDQERIDDLVRKKTSLNSSLGQIDIHADDAEALRALDRYTATLGQIRTDLEKLNAASLTERKNTLGTQKTALSSEVSALKTKKLSPQVEAKLDVLLSTYTKAEEELDKRITLETNRTELVTLQDGLAKMQREGVKDKHIKAQEELIITKKQEIRDNLDELRGFSGVSSSAELLRSTPEIPAASLIESRLEKGYEVTATIDGKSIPITNEKDLNKAYTGVIDPNRQQQLLVDYLGKKLDRSKLGPMELQYIVNYKQIQANINNDSRAVQLDELTHMNREFNNIKFGTGTDMRVMAEDMNRLLADEKVRAKYTKKAFQSAFTWALLEAYNRQNLMQIEYLMSNNRGIPDMQSMPTFFGEAPVDVWGAPYYLGAVAQQWFGPDRRNTGDIKAIVGKDLYNKYIKHLNVSLVSPYLYPTELPGSNVHRKPGRQGNAVITKTENGTREVLGDNNMMTDSALLSLYLQSYESYDVSGGTPENKLTTSPKYAYNVVDRWFTEGMDVIGGIKAHYMATGMSAEDSLKKANVVGEQLLVDAFKYDDDLVYLIRDEFHAQTDYYRAAYEQKQGHAVTDRDINKIPADQRYRMLSRAAVRGYARGFGHGQDVYSNIEQKLSQVYIQGGGGRDVTGQFVTNSNLKVGENISRLIDSHQKKPGFSISGRSFDDYSIDRMFDEIQVNSDGGFGVAGDSLTTFIQQSIPWIKPEQAAMLGGTLGSVAKWATIFFIGKTLREWSTSGKGFRGKAWRFGAVGVGAYILGKDFSALFFGGKGGILADGMRAFLDKGKDFGAEGLSSQQMLSFVFGKQSLNELFGILEVKDGKFVVSEGKMAQLSSGTGLDANQQEAIRSILGGSRDGLSDMINTGLTASGVTVNNYKDVLASSGTKTVSEYINGVALLSNSGGLLSEALGLDPNDPQVTELNDVYIRLSALEQKAFVERAEEMKTFGKTWKDMNVYISAHLIGNRRNLLDQTFTSSVVDLWKAGFANNAGVADLRKKFILGQTPFDKTQTSAANKVVFVNSMKTDIFGGNTDIEVFLNSTNVLADLEPFMTGTGDEKMTVDITQPTDANSRYVNRVATGAVQYKEMFVKGVDQLGSDAFLGVKEGPNALPNGNKESFLVFRLPNSDGTWEERQIDTIGGTALYTDGFGWVPPSTGGSSEFKMSLADGVAGSVTYETKYSPQLLRSSMQAAKKGNTEFDLSGREFTDPAAAQTGKVIMKKTGSVRQ